MTDSFSKLQNIKSLVGNTPLLEIKYTLNGKEGRVFAKAEYYNLTGSVKDRVAYFIMKSAYERGEISPADVIAEATSGNTGISFCAVGALLGHKVVIFMPDWMSRERIDIMRTFGADVCLVSKAEGGFLGSIDMCEKLAKDGGVFLPRQFSNPENVQTHYEMTGKEIAYQLRKQGLKADGFVAGVGTGGTVMGVGRLLKEVNTDCKVHPLEPENSPTLSTGYKVGIHKIQGISDEFIPDIVNLAELDEVVAVSDAHAICASRILANAGLGVGISSGANFLACARLQQAAGEDSVYVTLFADDNKKYLSTDYSDYEDEELCSELKILDVRAIGMDV